MKSTGKVQESSLCPSGFLTSPYRLSHAGMPGLCCLSRRAVTAVLTDAWFIHLSFLGEKQRNILPREILGQQLLPSANRTFPSSVYFNSLQIQDSVSPLSLQFRLLDSVFLCLGCFQSNKKVFFFLHILPYFFLTSALTLSPVLRKKSVLSSFLHSIQIYLHREMFFPLLHVRAR